MSYAKIFQSQAVRRALPLSCYLHSIVNRKIDCIGSRRAGCGSDVRVIVRRICEARELRLARTTSGASFVDAVRVAVVNSRTSNPYLENLIVGTVGKRPKRFDLEDAVWPSIPAGIVNEARISSSATEAHDVATAELDKTSTG